MAKAFRPVLPGMLAATYARGGQTEEVAFSVVSLPACSMCFEIPRLWCGDG